MLELESLADRIMDPNQFYQMTPFSLLLNIFFLNVPCLWVCCYFKPKKSFFRIMIAGTAGLFVCSVIAAIDGSWKVLYIENLIIGVFSLALGFWYSLRKKKESKQWTRFED